MPSPAPFLRRRHPGLAAALVLIAGMAALTAPSQPLYAQSPASKASDTTAKSKSRSGYAEVKGARFHYEVHGDLASDKKPLLMLHGAFMSGEAMKPLVTPFTASRPVITIDARGHGRTGDIAGTFSYDQLADDAAGVLAALGVKRADVLGYSMGGSTAIAMAVRHPALIDKQIVISGSASLDGWVPEVLEGIATLTPEFFAGTPMERDYKRLSPTPDAFPRLVEAIKHIDTVPFAYSDADLRAIPGKTMIILGDADGLTLDHAVKLFRLRGGSDIATATQGFMTAPPKARLSVLPATSHIGVMAEAATIAAQALPFLDEQAPPMPEGFF
ncbi:alpha/beta fold hydrolase [Sphingopyxis sp. MWB1]|uniref:alpha/beta fold hydrolase n=1 Tax=Sphingopyxis sp. MWB1 TaxID=1537715 RepID=UPI0009DF1B61|nr:alpha/beta hydrolase [Sphingopyxis sp. MWB1]